MPQVSVKYNAPPPPKRVIETVTLVMTEREATALAALLGSFGSEWGETPYMYSALSNALDIAGGMNVSSEYARLRDKAEAAITDRARRF